MKKKLLFALSLVNFVAFGQNTDYLLGPYAKGITGTKISTYGNVDSPVGETVGNIADENTNTKFLDFASEDGMGFVVEFNKVTRVRAIEIVTANDHAERDPKKYIVEGSNDGMVYQLMTEGVLTCDDARFFSRIHLLKNPGVFRYFRIVFREPCVSNPAWYAPIQLAGVQLFGSQSDNLAAEQFEDKSFVMYPNPVENVLRIDNLENKPVNTIELCDLRGRRLMYSKGGINEIDFSGLTKGGYLLKIELSSGEIVIKKVFKN